MGHFSTMKEMIVVSVSHVSKLSRKCSVFNTVRRWASRRNGHFPEPVYILRIYLRAVRQSPKLRPFPNPRPRLTCPKFFCFNRKKNSRVRIITPNFICCSHLRVNFLRNSFTVTRTWSALASEKGLTCMQFQALGRCTILYSVMFTVRCKQARWKIANWGMDCISWYFILLNYKCNQPISLTVLPKYLSSKSAFFHNV